MVAYNLLMNTAFHAVADPTRRALLERLRTSGPLSVTDLAGGLPITRQAVTKHLDALAESGLVRVTRSGRERLHELDAGPLKAVHKWLAPYEAEWERRLDRLRKHLEENP
jgi:DNA-binding transcriptional ArsR family regulator